MSIYSFEEISAKMLSVERFENTEAFNAILKAVFQLRVFYTYVQARKSLNLFQHYIWNEQMFWWREFSIPYDLTCFSDSIF